MRVLLPAGERGFYETTAVTEAWIAEYLAGTLEPLAVEPVTRFMCTRKRSAVRTR